MKFLAFEGIRAEAAQDKIDTTSEAKEVVEPVDCEPTRKQVVEEGPLKKEVSHQR